MSASDPARAGGEVSPAEPSRAVGKSVEEVVPVLEERAVVGTEAVTTGRVRVATRTHVMEEIAEATLAGETVEVERVAVGRPVSGELPRVRTEGDTTIVPVLEEVLVVEKRLMLKEELRIRRHATAETVRVPVELRHQEAAIERSDEG